MNGQYNFKIGKKLIGQNNKCIVVAEISANHNNNFHVIKKIIRSAKNNGADIIKIQTYTADILTIKSKKKDFLIKKENPWGKNKYLWNLYKKAETTNNLTKKIFKYCRSQKIEVFSLITFSSNAINPTTTLNGDPAGNVDSRPLSKRGL